MPLECSRQTPERLPAEIITAENATPQLLKAGQDYFTSSCSWSITIICIPVEYSFQVLL